ncbi:hypothetical protein [Hymenobacter edaphi]|uniref:hypothetical protein n=1 Tax=Hymenobacter edaphi TaxID=2211146 RepID=UPI001057E48F|nr:hypothetical protein [Hymenobacter edaphi]
MSNEEALATVTAALPIIAAAPSEAGLIQELMKRGVSRDTARQLSGFVPSAFGRVALQRYSPRFHDVYCLLSEVDGTHLVLPLTDEPIYCAALLLAQEAAANGTWNMQLHQLVALGSAEVNAINSLHEQGRNIHGLKFTPLILLWDIGPRTLKPGFVNPIPDFVPRLDNLNPDATKQATPPKPWWKFW